jgi:DNA polymerase-3 subunit epsilon
MLDFAAIDFETANYERTSVCSVGVVRGTIHNFV